MSVRKVAELAGVAPMTVSRVINTPTKVKPETRERVLKAIERLGYVPDLVASSLSSKRSRIVSALVPTLGNPMFSQVIQGLADTLRAADYHLIIGDTRYSAKIESALVLEMLGRRPEAIVLTGPVRDERVRKALLRASITVVQIWDLQPSHIVDCAVGFDNYAGAIAMMRHLIARGYRRIGFMAIVGDERARERQVAFREVLAQHKLTPTFEALPSRFDPAYDPTDEFIRQIEQHPETDAVFCASDMLAHLAIFACQRKGWAVPGRIALAGFGDLPLSAKIVPSLTSIRINQYEIGKRAAEIIIQRARGLRPRTLIQDLGYEIVERESTAPI